MKKMLVFLACFFFISNCIGQLQVRRVLTVEELFRLAEANTKQLQIAAQGIQISAQKTEIAKSDYLPEISATMDAGYLSNITIFKPDFSFLQTTHAPHFSNNYFLEASQTVFKGNYIKNNVRKSKLSEELAMLNFDEEEQDVKILLLGKYFDLFQLFNARDIYIKNIKLAERRLKDVESLRSQGMVTRNDIIRNQLQIEDFRLDLETIENNIVIINRDLCVTLGLSSEYLLAPDTSIYVKETPITDLDTYLQMAYTKQPAMKATKVSEGIAGKNIELERSAQWPTLSLYAGNALQRPFLLSLQPLDIYYNVYQAGIKLNYNISSIYHAKERIQLAKLEYKEQQSKTEFQRQKAEIEVHTAFTKYREARQRIVTLQKNLEFANENYRIVIKKYENQLALITDMLDASTAKVSAELQLSNGRINVINQWFKLQKASGDF